jgi:hypothetical protein
VIHEGNSEKYSVPTFFLAAAIMQFIALSQTQYANGWDGYYYIMQVQSFFQKGTLHTPDHSLVYPFYILLSGLIKDYIIAFKVGSAILAGIFVASAVVISGRSTPNKHAPYLVGAFFIFSPTFYFFTAQFPKNLMGLIFLIWFIYFLTDKRMIAAGIFFMLAFMTHRMMAGISLILLLLSFLQKVNLNILIPFLVISFIASYCLPGLIHYSDLARFTESFSTTLYFPPIRFLSFFGVEKLTWYWIIEIFVLFAAFLFCLAQLVYNYYKERKLDVFKLYLLIILLLLSLPIYSFGGADIGFRLYLVFILISIITFPFAMTKTPKWLSMTAIGILLMVSVFSFKSMVPANFDPPYENYFIVTKQMIECLDEKKVDLIIAHESLAQIIIIYSNFDATNWQAIDSAKYASTWRVSSDISYYHFKKYLNHESMSYLSHLHNDYYLLREDKWHQFYQNAIIARDSILISKFDSWINPTKPKPGYLTSRKEDKP